MINQFVPPRLARILELFDSVVQTHPDTIALAMLSSLASVSRASVSIEKEDISPRPIIIYSASLGLSGTGKSAIQSALSKYLLSPFQKIEDTKSDHQKDIILSASGSAQGLESSILSGSSPWFLIDELGLYLQSANLNDVKSSLVSSLMSLYDSGQSQTARLKNSGASKVYKVASFGVFASSTLAKKNLDISEFLQNGLLNRFLISWGGFKEIPLKKSLTKEEAKEVEDFALAFAKSSTNQHFYYSKKAIEFYTNFHKKVNHRYQEKFYNNDDTIGYEVRSLTLIERISAIYQICINIENNTPKNREISIEAIEFASGLLDYFDEQHNSQIRMFEKSKDGKITTAQRILNRISKSPSTKKEIFKNLSMYVNAKDFELIIHKLIITKRIQQDQAGKFYISSI